jgi:hypothetical protein
MAENNKPFYLVAAYFVGRLIGVIIGAMLSTYIGLVFLDLLGWLPI